MKGINYRPSRRSRRLPRPRREEPRRTPPGIILLPAPLPEAEARRRWEALQNGDTGAFDDVPLVPVKPA